MIKCDMSKLLCRLLAAWLALAPAAVEASQATLVTPAAPLPMTSLAGFLNAALLSVGSCQKGPSAPTNGTGGVAFAAECWANDTTSTWPFAYYDGASWVTLGSLNSSTHAWTIDGVAIGGATPAAGGFTTLTLTSTGTVTNTAAPGSPASGKVAFWTDSTDLRFHDKNSAGVIGTTVVASTCGTNLFGTSISAAGVFGCAQPSFSNLSGTATNAMLANMAAWTIKGNATSGSAAPTDFTIDGSLTLKASPVSADEVWIADSAASFGWKKTTVGAVASAGSVASVNQQTGSIILWSAPQGRLTLTSGTPVMSSSVAGATTVYYTGAGGGKNVPIYNGTAVAEYQFCSANTAGACELNIALGSNWATNSNYDFFIGLNSAVVTLCTGPAWSSQTVRGTGAGTSEIQQLDGLWTNKVSMTCRFNNTTTFTCAVNQCTYLGTMATGAAGQTNYVLGAAGSGGVAANLGLWNAYNRVNVTTTVTDNGTSYTYTPAAYRQARASASNQVQFLYGLPEESVTVNYMAEGTILGVAGSTAFTCVGLDTSAACSGARFISTNPAAVTNINVGQNTTFAAIQPLGLHILYPVEHGDGSNANGFDQGFGNLFIANLRM